MNISATNDDRAHNFWLINLTAPSEYTYTGKKRVSSVLMITITSSIPQEDLITDARSVGQKWQCEMQNEGGDLVAWGLGGWGLLGES